SDIANKREAKEFANRFLSPSDYLTSGLGVAGGIASGDSAEEKFQNALIGASLGFANKGARKYGNQLAAKGLDSLAKGISALPKAVKTAGSNPTATQSAVNKMNPYQGNRVTDMVAENPDLIDSFGNDKLKARLRENIDSKT